MNRRGFTLVEILIVIGIIGLLAGALIMAVSGFSSDARAKATEALMTKIQLAMDEYKKDFGDFPADGFDKEEYDNEDRQIFGSQVLVYKLAWRTGEKGAEKVEMKKPELQPGGDVKMVPVHGNRPYLELDDKQLGPGIHPDILDGWGNPIHYDYTVGGRGAYQDDPSLQYHNRENPQHKETDPRRKSKFSNTYDVWSHGNDADTEKPTADDDIMLK